jgi:hypothetical protein
MRAIAITALWVAIGTEIVWIMARVVRQDAGLGIILYAACVTLTLAGLAASRGRFRWAVTVVRMFIGVAFLGSVGDRFGLFGSPGAPGVSWGNFTNFAIYTGQMNSFLPNGMIPALAAAESVIEGVLGLGMLFGAWLRVTVWASSVLLFLFGIAMTISLGVSSQFPYAVFVLATGGWLLASVDASFISADALFARARRPPSHWSARRMRE